MERFYKKHGEKVRFLATGVANTGIDFGLYALLASVFGMAALVANVLSVSVAIVFSFFVNKKWVWKSEKKSSSTVVPFLAVTFFTGYIVQSLVIMTVTHLPMAVNMFGSDAWLELFAKVCGIATAMIVNFLAYRYIFKS